MTARFVLKYALAKQDRKCLWLKNFEIEKQYGSI